MAYTPILEIVIRTIVVYFIVLAGLRLTGKREVGQMTPFDLTVLLLIANSVQASMVGDNTSIVGGVAAAVTLFLVNGVVLRLVWKKDGLRSFIEGSPTLLINDSKVLAQNLAKEKISREVLEEALREHGVADVSLVKLAVLEIDGSISVIRHDDMPTIKPHSRFRFLRKKP